MLSPKRVKFRKRFKGRTSGLAHRGSEISFGTYGLQTLEPGWITARQIEAFLMPKSAETQNQSSLDHAIATGEVTISDAISPTRTRTGTGEHCEYYTKQDKVVLNGGAPQMVDSHKGVIKGQQLTYFSGEDHLIVDGKKKQLAFTRMKKK